MDPKFETFLSLVSLLLVIFAGIKVVVDIFGLKKKEKKKSASDYSYFADDYNSIEEVSEALRKAGLETSNLMIAVDFTASNHSQGKRTFGGKCLHAIGEDILNPYEKVIDTIGKTLSQFSETGQVASVGFGDISTKGNGVFPFYPNGENRYCQGFEEVLKTYRHIAPLMQLSGPTNFAPAINACIELCQSSGTAEYYILIIICDGIVTHERETIEAIVRASKWPISIVAIGVGDGPFDQMETFDDDIPARDFDNFQFVEFDKTIKEALRKGKNPDSAFALNALMEIPGQFTYIKKTVLGKKSSTTRGNIGTYTGMSRR